MSRLTRRVDMLPFVAAVPGAPITIDDLVQKTGQTYTFTARRSGDVSAARTVGFVVSGATDTPALPSDFGGAFPTGSVNFLAGSATATFAVSPTSSAQPE